MAYLFIISLKSRKRLLFLIVNSPIEFPFFILSFFVFRCEAIKIPRAWGVLWGVFYELALFRDGLVLGHEGLHNEPADEVGYGTVAEDDHIACGLACGSEELEGIAEPVGIGEEHA